MVGIQLSLSEGPGSEGVLASGSLVLLPGAAAALAQGSAALNGPLAQQLLQELGECCGCSSEWGLFSEWWHDQPQSLRR